MIEAQYICIQLFQLTWSDVFKPYATRLNGDLGVRWNLHIIVDENYKFLFFRHEAKAWRECTCPLSYFYLFILQLFFHHY